MIGGLSSCLPLLLSLCLCSLNISLVNTAKEKSVKSTLFLLKFVDKLNLFIFAEIINPLLDGMGYTLKLSYVTLIVRGFTEHHGTKIVIFNQVAKMKKKNSLDIIRIQEFPSTIKQPSIVRLKL